MQQAGVATRASDAPPHRPAPEPASESRRERAPTPLHEARSSAPPPTRRVIPDATIARLPLYLRVLTALADAGVATVSSQMLAAAAGVTSAKVRKDLSQLGSYGTRGVGYEVDCLVDEISRQLGVTSHRAVAIIGVGNLGHALAGYGGFAARGFRIAALFDADPRLTGEVVAGLRVRGMDELEQTVRAERICIGVIATPAAAAQQVCDRLVACGVTSVLNFAPTVLGVPDGVDVRKVDLALELQILSFHEARKEARAARSADPRLVAAGAGG